MTNWNVRCLGVDDGFGDLEQSLKKSCDLLQVGNWDVLCLQEPGMMEIPKTHLQYKCKRNGGWGASIIVHENYCNRVVYNTCGTNWVLIGLDFNDLGWPGIGILSAHLPPQKTKTWMTLNIEALYRRLARPFWP
jgi:hypothetical protein